MVERYRRGKGKRKLLGNHQKCWLWGRHVVLETLRAGTWPILELFLSGDSDSQSANEASRLAAQWNLPLTVESTEQLRQRCGSAEHQGYVAKMAPFPYADFATIRSDGQLSPHALIVICDGIQDPHNFGAIIRTADALSVDAIVIPDVGQVGVTSLVARSSVGAVSHVPIARVTDLVGAVTSLTDEGFQAVAATEKSSRAIYDCDFGRPTVLVFGNEGQGIRSELLNVCEHHVAIPQQGHVASLNAAVSAGIVLYEIRRQQSSDDRTEHGTSHLP